MHRNASAARSEWPGNRGVAREAKRFLKVAIARTLKRKLWRLGQTRQSHRAQYTTPALPASFSLP